MARLFGLEQVNRLLHDSSCNGAPAIGIDLPYDLDTSVFTIDIVNHGRPSDAVWSFYCDAVVREVPRASECRARAVNTIERRSKPYMTSNGTSIPASTLRRQDLEQRKNHPILRL